MEAESDEQRSCPQNSVATEREDRGDAGQVRCEHSSLEVAWLLSLSRLKAKCAPVRT